MFQFITISNGAAVVQHMTEGHVYRFKLAQNGAWDKLSTVQTEHGENATGAPEEHLAGALAFAEEASSSCFRYAEASAVTYPSPSRRLPFRILRSLFKSSRLRMGQALGYAT
ncbi:hypothetical protein [Lichenifustis flavocetrariae]|uniref:Uncharacterized protein n=1 Tax=Lichenifustis flavocetrariae TaxID=2949735 RepID=A0AA41Z9E3_9HYPH|nr:hypothetical protein [Lichenifustis flavocetrariae]MCW6512923.1 hypothetical protein [Lichenifustis flavocetrariae]